MFEHDKFISISLDGKYFTGNGFNCLNGYDVEEFIKEYIDTEFADVKDNVKYDSESGMFSMEIEDKKLAYNIAISLSKEYKDNRFSKYCYAVQSRKHSRDDIDKIKEVALGLLNLEYILNKKAVDGNIYVLGNDYTFFNHSKEFENYADNFRKSYYYEMCNLRHEIESSKLFVEILYLIHDNYKMYFTQLVEPYLSKESLNKTFRHSWLQLDSQSKDNQLLDYEKIKIFEQIETKSLMNSYEVEKIHDLPYMVTIYRASSLEDDYDKVSWTLDYGNALYLAKNKGATAYVLEGQVSKDDIIALFDPDGRKEVIVRYYNIKNKEFEVVKNIKI